MLWKFSLPAVLSAALASPIDWGCAALLVNRPNGYSEMGIYIAASQWCIALLYLPGILNGVMLPVLTEQLGRNNKRQSARTLILAIQMNALVVLPLVLAGTIASPGIMKLYGPTFGNGWPTLVVVLLTAGLIAVHTPVGQMMAASGKMWLWFAMNVGWALTFIAGTLWLIDRGSLGLAAARGIAYVFQTAWTLGFAVWWMRGKEETAPRGYAGVPTD